MRKPNKKGQVFDNLAGLAVGIATFTIIIVVTLLVISNVKTQEVDIGDVENAVCGINGTTAFNATCTLQEAAIGVPSWIPLVVIVAIGAVILGMIGMFNRR